MRKIISFLMLITAISYCKGHDINNEQKGYNFDNFKNTPLEVAAIAARNNDGQKIRELLSKHKDIIDLKDPLFQQTLLALTIQNNKREAFAALLELGSNPNMLLSNPIDATPFTYGIKNVEDCDLFYVKKMLSYGADSNLEIKYKEGSAKPNEGFPLLIAIGNLTSEGEECVDLVKLLVDHGANIDVCQTGPSGLCEGVITLSLTYKSMYTLKYFIIDKKIKIPDIVYTKGSINKATEKKYNLTEALNSKDFQFDNPRNDDWKQVKTDILSYLKKQK